MNSEQEIRRLINFLNENTKYYDEGKPRITDKQWEAIQAGAISENKLKLILNNSDPDILRERSMPSNRKGLTAAQISRIKAMANSNFTLQQIADKLGISKSTVSNALKGAK